MYIVLDYFFAIFHFSLILFNLTGWIWRKTQRFHLITISLTLLSWFGLGIFYGWGYCPSTHWHWQVKYRLGEFNLPASYVTYYLDKFTGLSWDPLVVDILVLVLALFSFSMSCWFNWKSWKSHSRS
jgi:hypothetical protein